MGTALTVLSLSRAWAAAALELSLQRCPRGCPPCHPIPHPLTVSCVSTRATAGAGRSYALVSCGVALKNRTHRWFLLTVRGTAQETAACISPSLLQTVGDGEEVATNAHSNAGWVRIGIRSSAVSQDHSACSMICVRCPCFHVIASCIKYLGLQ